MQILLKTQLTSMELLRVFLKDFGIKYHIQNHIISDMDLALGELVLNIIKYGFQDQQNTSISINGKIENHKITFVVIDEGIPFNPLDYEIKNLPKDIKDRDIGGLGIRIAKQLVDEMLYHRTNNKNTLTLIKYINNETS